MPGEFGTSPDVSEEIELEGDGGATTSSCTDDERGVWQSNEVEIPVRRRFEGGIFMLFDAAGDCPWTLPYLVPSCDRASSSMLNEETAEPGESVILFVGYGDNRLVGQHTL